MIEVKGTFSPHKAKLLLIAGAVLLVIGAAVAGFFAWQHFTDPTRANRETISRIVGDIGNVYELPTDEQPTVAQLQDPASLKTQEFYQKAQKGDYVLIYTKAELAILYRESTKKLINVDRVKIAQP